MKTERNNIIKLVFNRDAKKQKPMPNPFEDFFDFWVPFIVFTIFSAFTWWIGDESALFVICIFSWFYFYKRGIAYTKRENYKPYDEK